MDGIRFNCSVFHRILINLFVQLTIDSSSGYLSSSSSPVTSTCTYVVYSLLKLKIIAFLNKLFIDLIQHQTKPRLLIFNFKLYHDKFKLDIFMLIKSSEMQEL